MANLREYKKNKTKMTIQEHALRLFARQGYAQTTIEQIATSAEVSPSTIFRAFSTKEDIVLYDGLNPLIIKMFHEQPPDLNVIQAFRRTIQTVYEVLPPERLRLEHQRSQLVHDVPQVAARTLEKIIRDIAGFAEIIGQRSGKDAHDISVRNLAGALIGVGLAVMMQSRRHDMTDSMLEFDRALAEFERAYSSL